MPPTPAEPAGTVLRQIGQWLREARTQYGLDLHDVAEALRIKRAYLEALEEGSLAAMPGRPYALGFLRSYAVFLGLDGEELVRRVKAAERGGSLGGRPELSVPTPIAESRVPKGQLLVLSLFLVVALYGGWRYVNDDARPPAETVAEVPQELRDVRVRGLPPAHPVAPSDPARAFASESPAFLPPTEIDGDEPPPPVAALAPEPWAPAAAPAPGAATVGPDSAAAPDPEEPVFEAPAVDGETVAEAPAVPDEVATAADVPPAWRGTGAGAAEPEPATAGGGAGGTADSGVENAVAATLVDGMDFPPADEPSAAGEAPGAVGGDAGRSASELLAALDTDAASRAREGRVYGRTGGDGRVRLEAVDTSWIQVRSADNTYTYTRTLQPGDVYVVPDRADLALWTGNAGGLQIVVDGRNLPPLGRSREVKRDIPLDPAHLLDR